MSNGTIAATSVIRLCIMTYAARYAGRHDSRALRSYMEPEYNFSQYALTTFPSIDEGLVLLSSPLGAVPLIFDNDSSIRRHLSL